MLKTIFRWVGRILAVVVVLVVAFVGYFAATWQPTFPDTPLPAIEASDDPEVIARGDYLFNAVAHCSACHSPMDDYLAAKSGELVVPKGGHAWRMGPLGTIRSANITPDEATGIGNYSDAELARAIRHGVAKDGTGALFMMSVGPMSDEDLTALVSYMKTIEPVSNEVPASEIGIMGKVLFQTAMDFFSHPHDYGPVMPPYVPEGDTPSIERGKYLANGPAFCAGCHNQIEAKDGQVAFVGPTLAGRVDPDFPDETEEGFTFVAPNLTPHASGIMNGWTREQFVKRFRNGRAYAGSPMPWETYRNMTDADLESVYMYLTSLEGVDNTVGPSRQEKK